MTPRSACTLLVLQLLTAADYLDLKRVVDQASNCTGDHASHPRASPGPFGQRTEKQHPQYQAAVQWLSSVQVDLEKPQVKAEVRVVKNRELKQRVQILSVASAITAMKLQLQSWQITNQFYSNNMSL
jgi:hypothetical protein